jgi:hypothetical protein
MKFAAATIGAGPRLFFWGFDLSRYREIIPDDTPRSTI